MTREIGGIVARNVSGLPVASIEDGGVWLSGMNAYLGREARRVKSTLEACGYTVGELEDEHGGYYMSVEGAKALDELPGENMQ